ncbi:hypothetical protein QR680_008611 [Steinernema hermaphroditum]|uniref:Gamma-aminobutyric acid receptor subunit beta n=1 Tax=Steinernema hermaphroditum TaxID=289476 RepID=A0AA39M869_9BILA|nr:hypothetical protein QR680_008611 [Steinernema hermaphroditum]
MSARLLQRVEAPPLRSRGGFSRDPFDLRRGVEATNLRHSIGSSTCSSVARDEQETPSATDVQMTERKGADQRRSPTCHWDTFFWLLALLATARVAASPLNSEHRPDVVDFYPKSDKEIENNSPTYSRDDDDTVSPSPRTTESIRLEHNVSRLLDALIASHDRRIRPNYGGPPTEVNVTIHVITISAVSEVSMDYTVDLYLRQFWRDERLSFESLSQEHSSLTIGIDMVKSIWTPDTFFPNEKRSFFHEATSHNSFLRIDNHGNVVRSIRLTVTANCPMNLHTFPLDVQVCALEIESYGYSTNDISYHWHHANAVTMDENVHLAHFAIGEHYHIERVISLSTGNYSRLTTYFTFQRNIGFYLIQIYFPASLIVVISWVSFWLNRDATQARVAIGVTTVLTMTTLMTSTNASLPKVSYVKSLDIFLGVCFFIVFASLLEYAAIGYLMKRRRKPPKMDESPPTKASITCYYEIDDQAVHVNAVRKEKKSKKNGLEQAMPLLTLSPQHVRLTPSSSQAERYFVFCVRPSQVDLFSRVAFPLFFALFHIAYWTFYLHEWT